MTKERHPFGCPSFWLAAGFENRIQAASWMAAKQLFSAQQKMQMNPFCPALPIGRQFLAIKPSASGRIRMDMDRCI